MMSHLPLPPISQTFSFTSFQDALEFIFVNTLLLWGSGKCYCWYFSGLRFSIALHLLSLVTDPVLKEIQWKKSLWDLIQDYQTTDNTMKRKDIIQSFWISEVRGRMSQSMKEFRDDLREHMKELLKRDLEQWLHSPQMEARKKLKIVLLDFV